MKLGDLVDYLNSYLRTAEIPDYPTAYNGLQVDGKVEVKHVAVAVDACTYAIDQAVSAGADMLIVHHGALWSDLRPLTARSYRRLAPLVKSGMSLYAVHLPLDCHPEVGNCAGLLRMLDMSPAGTFGSYQGTDTGWWSEAGMARTDLADSLRRALGSEVRIVPTGPERVQRVGVVTGDGGGHILEAHAAGLDTLITGEMRHQNYFDAEELGVNVLLGGHYATEAVGVKLLAQHLSERLKLKTSFISHPTGL
ncbi:MAG: Nif3-like dinuclear metal center hexameric protein [Armatimonadota bacterium]